MDKQVRIAYVGISIWNNEGGYFVGDMGYACSEEADTRVFEESGYAGLRENLENWINSNESEEESGEDFYVYEIHTATATVELYDDDDDDDDEEGVQDVRESDLWSADLEDDDTITEVFVCAPREVAEDIIRDEYGMFVTAHYKGE